MNNKILNIGCWNETYGTHLVDLYPSRKDVVKCNVDEEKLPFKNNFFDIVYSKNLFEHLRNPGFVLGEMVRVLKKGGELILVTDNSSYYLFNFLKAYSAHYNNYKEHGMEDKHYILFTTKHIENWMSSFKLKIVRLELITDYDPNLSNPVFKYPRKNSKLALPNRLLGHLPVISQIAFPRILVVAKKP
ncbi:MAG TPA: class I SAM-dependent methyltransferase [Candidatus Nanoarchaeia archaeon]|nr:class I SAM-dependent methyltransferase [Candidatus Nanoarchaeia archaeon]